MFAVSVVGFDWFGFFQPLISLLTVAGDCFMSPAILYQSTKAYTAIQCITMSRILQVDIVKIINQSGTVFASYVYDAWGNIKSVTGDPNLRELNPFRYRSYVYDSESGLYYLQSRYYDPFTGRFLNADDTAFIGATRTALSGNLFTYCDNNPISLIDRSGKFGTPLQWAMAVVVGIAGWFLEIMLRKN